MHKMVASLVAQLPLCYICVSMSFSLSELAKAEGNSLDILYCGTGMKNEAALFNAPNPLFFN